MADFGCFVWSDSPELRRARAAPGADLDLSLLGVSHGLRAELTSWHAEWERSAYGGGSPPDGQSETWEARGWELAGRLQDELPDIDVLLWFETAARAVPVAGRLDGGVVGSH